MTTNTEMDGQIKLDLNLIDLDSKGRMYEHSFYKTADAAAIVHGYTDRNSLPEGKILVARDISAELNGAKQFAVMTPKELIDLLEHLYTNNLKQKSDELFEFSLYEGIDGQKGFKWYLDMDYKPEDFHIEEEMNKAIYEGIIKLTKNYADKYDIDVKMLVLQADTKLKHSRHGIANFTVPSAKHAILLYHLIHDSMPEHLQKYNERQKCFDPRVYKNTQFFRTIFSSKKGKKNPLIFNQEASTWQQENIREIIENSLITHITDDLMSIDFPIEDEHKLFTNKLLSDEERIVEFGKHSSVFPSINFYNEFELGPMNKSGSTLLKRIKPSACPLCPLTKENPPYSWHHSQNAYLTSYKGNIYYGCYNAPVKANGKPPLHLLSKNGTTISELRNGETSEERLTLTFKRTLPDMNAYDDYYVDTFIKQFSGQVFDVAVDGWKIVTSGLLRICRRLVRADNTVILKESPDRPFHIYHRTKLAKLYDGFIFKQQVLITEGENEGKIIVKKYPLFLPVNNESDFLVRDVIWKPYHQDEPSGTNENQINVFPGYRAKKIELNADDLVNLDKFKAHIFEVWCKKDEILFKFVMTWLLQPIRNKRRTETCLFLFSKNQGAGKTSILDVLMKWVYGDPITSAMENLDELFEKFTDVSEKLFILIKEAADGDFNKSLKRRYNKFKGYITDELGTSEKKFCDKRATKNNGTFAMGTNNYNAIAPEPSCRRIVFVECSEHLVGNKDYFIDFHGRFNNQHFGNVFYSWALMGDTSEFNVDVRYPPMTQLKAQLISLAKNTVESFLDEIFNTDDHSKSFLSTDQLVFEENKIGIRCSNLHKCYVDFVMDRYGKNIAKNLNQFSAEASRSEYMTHHQRGYLGKKQCSHFILNPNFYESTIVNVTEIITTLSSNPCPLSEFIAKRHP